MQLYTLVSLCVGLYGGTYSSINAFKSNFEETIKRASENNRTYLDKIRDENGEGAILDDAKKRCKIITRNNRIWAWSNRIPAIVFAITLFSVGACALYHWDLVEGETAATSPPAADSNGSGGTKPTPPPVSAPRNYRDVAPWKYSKTILVCALFVNFAGISFAFGSWWRCRISFAQLTVLYRGALDAAAKKVTPVVTPPELVTVVNMPFPGSPAPIQSLLPPPAS